MNKWNCEIYYKTNNLTELKVSNKEHYIAFLLAEAKF